MQGCAGLVHSFETTIHSFKRRHINVSYIYMQGMQGLRARAREEIKNIILL